MYFIKTPQILKTLYPYQVWDVPVRDKSIFLTFDDGPTPGVTEWTLNALKEYKAKATFFLVGENVKKHPELAAKIVTEGHHIGNHTQNHINGWETETRDYLKNTL